MAADPWARHRGGARPPVTVAESHRPTPERAPASGNPSRELRMYGLNAVRAVFERRPDAIRKLYLDEARIPLLQPLLKWCAAHRVGGGIPRTRR